MAAPYALIVEDDPMAADLFRRAVQDAGYQTELMDNGHKAQSRLIFTTPELILIDIHLPSLSGGVLLRQVRGQQRLWHTRVVVVTGDSQAAKEYEGLVDQVLLKPVGYEQLRKVAEQFLSVSA